MGNKTKERSLRYCRQYSGHVSSSSRVNNPSKIIKGLENETKQNKQNKRWMRPSGASDPYLYSSLPSRAPHGCRSIDSVNISFQLSIILGLLVNRLGRTLSQPVLKKFNTTFLRMVSCDSPPPLPRFYYPFV